MLVTQIKQDGILQVEPKGALSVNDFNALAAEVDAMDSREETLKGVLIRSESFPGYEHLSDISAHARFVNKYGNRVPKVAICSDSAVTAFLSFIGQIFTDADVKRFRYDEKEQALAYLGE
ncbi:MAG TPA: STAS/SEC14 domain-containing protein [Woeseiaceae bacterium]|nr:STAS/SEC14 domain-containing protein [Woeseiaceae bacterium]